MLNKILVDFGAHGGTHLVRIDRAEDAKRARRRYYDYRLGLASGQGGFQLVDEINEEGPLGLVVPIGLLDGAADAADRVHGAAGSIGAKLVGSQVLLLQNLDHLEIRKLGVTAVLQH